MTILDALTRRLAEASDALALRFLDAPPEDATWTGAALLDLASRAAGALAEAGVGPGDRVAWALPTGPEWPALLLGAWRLGAAAVPLAPASPVADAGAEGDRLARTLAAAGAKLIVAEPHSAAALAGFDGPWRMLAPEALAAGPALPEGPGLAPGAAAVIQFSSGSTGAPKGAVIPHEAVEANLNAIREGIAGSSADRLTAWLPLHHDMGLFGVLLFGLRWGIETSLMRPETFIRQPRAWLQAMHETRATLSVAPNFAYALGAKLPASALEGLDLSAWRVALCGAEPIRPEALEYFAKKLAPAGFDPRALMPTYGLAEATLAVAMTPVGTGPRWVSVDREAYLKGEAAAPAPDAPDAVRLADVGPPLPGVAIAIRDPDGRKLPEREAGHIWVKTPAVMTGYLENADASREALVDGWLDTGDLGFLAEGRLVVTGRAKDLLVRGGRKIHPQDVEAIAERVPGARPGGSAAFALPDASGVERVALLLETAETDDQARLTLTQAAREAVMAKLGLRIDRLALVPPRTVPKTTSGKVRRAAARARYLALFEAPAEASAAVTAASGTASPAARP